jgi:hypothetical protein
LDRWLADLGGEPLVPQFALRWNAGVNNYMTYITDNIPVGAYQSTRLANLGIGTGRSTPVVAIPISIRDRA